MVAVIFDIEGSYISNWSYAGNIQQIKHSVEPSICMFTHESALSLIRQRYAWCQKRNNIKPIASQFDEPLYSIVFFIKWHNVF